MTAAPYQVMPPLTPEERERLKADIAERGVLVPIEYDELGQVLDGHHRVELCGELGVTQWPRIIRHGLTEDEKRTHARRINLDRRHLTPAQRRDLIEQELRERPQASDRAIGEGLGVDHKTVGAVRDGLESTGEIPQLDKREGRDGRRRIVQFVPGTEAEVKGVIATVKAINEARRTEYRETARSLAREMSDTTALAPVGRKFPVVYADPAWQRKAGFGDRAYENHYATMSWDDICALPVRDMLLPDAWLFLWIPRAHLLALHSVAIETQHGPVTVPLPLAWAVARAWGFDNYSTCSVWTKTDDEHPDDHGSGLIFFDQDEILCLFKRGRGIPAPKGSEKFGSNHRERSKPLGHSRKPDFYRHMISTMTGGLPVLELFARDDDEHPLPKGWQGWGNESASWKRAVANAAGRSRRRRKKAKPKTRAKPRRAKAARSKAKPRRASKRMRGRR